MLTRHLPLALCALAACKGGGLGQIGEDEDQVCVEAGADALADLDLVVVGHDDAEVVVADARTMADGTFVATLTWEATGEQTPVTLDSSSQAGTAELVHYDPADPEIPAHNCPDRLRFEVSGTLATDDGRLDEAFATTAFGDGASVYMDPLVQPITGTLDPTALAVGPEPVEPDQIDLHLVLRSTSPPFSGQIKPVRTDIPGEDVTPLGGWPGEQEE